jgi:putative ABC transport system ATP-binding protein
VVTHEPDIAAHCHRTVRIGDGRIVEDRANPPRAAVAAATPGANHGSAG